MTGIKRKIVLILLFFATSLLSHAQIVAVHPLFSGDGRTVGMINTYYTALLRAIPNTDRSFRVYTINLDDDVRPADVPAGGFPPWICPAPSITGNAEYAITGEVAEDQDYPGYYRLRLYFWRLEGSLLLVSDEITATNRDEAEAALPYLLEWLFSAIGRDASLSRSGGGGGYGQGQGQGLFAQLFRHDYWLYLGARLGVGSSDWYYYENKTYGVIRQPVTLLYDFNIALHATGQFLPYLALQAEIQFSSDLNTTGKLTSETTSDAGLFSLWTLHIPVFLKFTINHNNFKAGLFGGVYFYFPVFETGDEYVKQYFTYSPDQPGFLFGLSIGYKFGPGHIILDGRFEYDGHWRTSEKTDAMYYRHLIKIGIGYEIGLFDHR